MSRTVMRGLAAVSAVTFLLVLGMALRPLVITESPEPVTPVLGDIEIGFVQDMAAHHQQALQMTARLSPDVDPVVTTLARSIDLTQRYELGMLLGWLELAQAPPVNSHPMQWHGGAHAHGAVAGQPAIPMPGMATLDELDALSAAHGRDAEVLFLQLMQRHHAGAVAMARAADAQLSGGVVAQFARGAMQEQSKEAGLMTIMLEQRAAAPLG
ncbi:DUF305 domain-containing protein [Rhodococcus pyridinivorans]|uniref:DUF305 domain-containing protein n=1 Tax=Rhodococcus pyridinivorans TaxID=103816 RepID=UPI001E33C441|nr:DUF305 domain-containing protein [Rhodococcus pyridinivorans]MCD5421322.1 DUF305 domain-containing protein [Rhodococcus pyridinivorans]